MDNGGNGFMQYHSQQRTTGLQCLDVNYSVSLFFKEKEPSQSRKQSSLCSYKGSHAINRKIIKSR